MLRLIAPLFADLRSASERTGFPSPVGGKTRSLPTHNRLGPDDRNGIKYARTATIEPNEQSTVSPTQMQSMWRAPLQNIELMTQNRTSASSRRRDLRQSHSIRRSSKAIAITGRSCSDSLLTASQTD